METTVKTEKIAELQQKISTDRNVVKEIFRIFRDDMLREARIFIADIDQAKGIVIKAFRSAYGGLASVSPDQASEYLNEYVRAECIRSILPIEKSVTQYSADDEIPDKHAELPADDALIKKQLLTVLDLLTPSQRLVSVLRYRDQMSDGEIASTCHTTKTVVLAILADAKNAIQKSNVTLGYVLAMVNKLYPFYTEPAESEGDSLLLDQSDSESGEFDFDGINNLIETSKAEHPENNSFDQTVSELKEFFNTRALSVKHISDHDIDDTDEENAEDDLDRTIELPKVSTDIVNDTASSAKMLISSTMNADSKDDEESDENPVTVWLKRIGLLLLIAAIAFFVGILVSDFLAHRNASDKPEHEQSSETAKEDENENNASEENNNNEQNESGQNEASPEPTAEIDDSEKVIGQATILVTDLTIRKGPGVAYEQSGIVDLDSVHDVYEAAEGDGYTWYRIGEDEWVADLSGQFVAFVPAE